METEMETTKKEQEQPEIETKTGGLFNVDKNFLEPSDVDFTDTELAQVTIP